MQKTGQFRPGEAAMSKGPTVLSSYRPIVLSSVVFVSVLAQLHSTLDRMSDLCGFVRATTRECPISGPQE